MREIMFRAKSIDSKKPGEWVCGYLTVNPHNLRPVIFDGVNTYYINEDTLGQNTGLQDRKGQDIYEGDICQINYVGKLTGKSIVGNQYQVAWCASEASFTLWDGFTHSAIPNPQKLLVIGQSQTTII